MIMHQIQISAYTKTETVGGIHRTLRPSTFRVSLSLSHHHHSSPEQSSVFEACSASKTTENLHPSVKGLTMKLHVGYSMGIWESMHASTRQQGIFKGDRSFDLLSPKFKRGKRMRVPLRIFIRIPLCRRNKNIYWWKKWSNGFFWTQEVVVVAWEV